MTDSSPLQISADEREMAEQPARAAGYLVATNRSDQRSQYAGALPRGALPVPSGLRQPGPGQMRAPQVANGPRDTITVKELMINVIERSLSGPGGAGQAAPAAPAAVQQGGLRPAHPATLYSNPTIHNLLEHSDPPEKRQGGNAGAKVSMPPPAPAGDCETLDLSLPRKRDPSPPSSSSSHGHYREPPAVLHHPRSSPSVVKQEYQAPPPAHSGSKKTTADPFYRGDPRNVPSPIVYGSDGRPLPSQSPHALQRSAAQSPGLGRPGSAGVLTTARSGGAAQYAARPPPPGGITSGAPLKGGAVSPRTAAVVAAAAAAGRPLGGSITQGTPVNQVGGGPHRYESLVRMTPPEKAGPITHGPPVSDKRQAQLVGLSDHARAAHDGRVVADYYRGGRSAASPGGAYAYPPASSAPSAAQGRAPPTSYPNDQHLNSRQVILNDYEMARSREMQRRPESREAPRSVSPRLVGGRDLSPRPRSLDHHQQRILGGDPHTQLEVRRDGRIIETRYDPRAVSAPGLPNHRGDPKAELRALDPRAAAELRLPDHRSSLEARGDPRAGLDPRLDSRVRLDPRSDLRVTAVDPRTEPRLTHERREEVARVVDPRSAAAAIEHRGMRVVPGSSASFYAGGAQAAHVFMASDAKYAARPRSPPRSSSGLPPATAAPHRASAIVHRPPPGAGGITSGKPIVTKPGAPVGVDIYLTNPEVTISKTSSPRHNYEGANALTSLVDVAVQQKKLQEGALLQQQAVAAAAAVAAAQAQGAMRPGYEAAAARQQQLYNLEKSRYATAAALAAGHIPTAASTTASIMAAAAAAAAVSTASPSSSSQQLVEQVRSERAKQQLYMMQQGKEKAPASFPAAVHLPAKEDTAVARRPEATATAGEGSSRPLTAANLIDAIITHSINSGSPADGGVSATQMQKTTQYGRNPAEAAVATPQEDLAKIKARSSPGKEPNGPEEGPSASLSRPGSRSSSATASTEHREGDDKWERRGSNAGAMPAPRATATGLTPAATPSAADERQIVKVAQLPPSSPGRQSRESPAPTVASICDAGSKSLSEKAGSPHQQQQAGGSGPGLSQLSDYVKNKIVEEMKKGEDGPSNNAGSPPKSPSSSSVSVVPAQVGNKRPSDGDAANPVATTNGENAPAKKIRLDSDGTAPSSSGEAAVVTVNSTSGVAHVNVSAPDSPGSEGEMVIDESVRPDSVGQEGKADAPNASNEATTTTAKANSIKTTAPVTKKPAQPTYEPLSDDE